MTPVWTPPPPVAPPLAPAPPASTDHWRVIGSIVTVFTLIAAVAVVTVVPSKSWYPSRWDPRIAPVAAKVSQLRGLNFVHPVQVHFLTQSEFDKELVGDGAVSAAARAEFTTEAAVLRALGLISRRDDLAQAMKDQAESDVAAFYSDVAKEVFVNGTTFDVEHRVTVAHELTHVLQDQHFDLAQLRKRAVASTTGDTEGYTALVEGDAVRIETAYLKTLRSADQSEYAVESSAASSTARAGGSNVPDIVSFLFGAPYAFGATTVRILFDTGGNLAVDDALTGPTPGARILLEPAELDAPRYVAAPAPPAGASPVSRDDQVPFSAFELYPMLAATLAPSAALHAADVVDGTGSLTYALRGKVCEAVDFRPRSKNDTVLASALRQWVKRHPSGSVSVHDDVVALTACDPGTGVAAPSSARFRDAARFLVARTHFTESIARGKTPIAAARCEARVVMQDPALAPIAMAIESTGNPTAAQAARLRSAAPAIERECARDPHTGLR